MSEKEDTIDIVKAYEICGILPGKLATMARRGEIPGVIQIGGSLKGWRFNRKAFLAWDDRRRETTD